MKQLVFNFENRRELVSSEACFVCLFACLLFMGSIDRSINQSINHSINQSGALLTCRNLASREETPLY